MPAESAISSSKIQVLSFTSPMIFITSDSPAFSLLLSAIASPASNLLAKALALTTPPTSGEATTKSLFPLNLSLTSSIIGLTEKILSKGMSKKP